MADGKWSPFRDVMQQTNGPYTPNGLGFYPVASAFLDESEHPLWQLPPPPPPKRPVGDPGMASPVDCYPGYVGASACVVTNITVDGDTVSVWRYDLVTGVPTLIGDIGAGQQTQVPLTNCHVVDIIAVSRAWVVDYNEHFDLYHHDPHDWQTAQTINFQRAKFQILGRQGSAPVATWVS
jgi:hypothetical protein